MKAIFINDFGIVDERINVSSEDEIKKLNKKLEETGMDDFGWWCEDNGNYCPDCGKVGEIRGHMECEYPSDLP